MINVKGYGFFQPHILFQNGYDLNVEWRGVQGLGQRQSCACLLGVNSTRNANIAQPAQYFVCPLPLHTSHTAWMVDCVHEVICI